MMPDNVLSVRPAPTQIIGARANPDITARFDQEDGGVALQDPSQGLMYQTWTAEARDGGVWLSAPNFPAQMIRAGNISECSIAFDRAMNWVLAFVEDGVSKLSYYSNLDDERIEITLDGTNPRVIHDDKRPGQSDVGEVLVTYVRDETLYQLRQRDRYGEEFHIGGVGIKGLVKVGMGSNLRLHFVTLRVFVNKTALLAALTEANTLNPLEYTQQSWQPVAVAREAGQGVLDDHDATRDQVSSASAALNAALAGLVPVADKSALIAALNDAAALDEADYMQEGWLALQDAVEVGRTIRDENGATQAEVNVATASINSAIGALVLSPTVDKTGLNAALSAASALNEAEYTPASWQPLHIAVAAGQALADDPDASQHDVNSLTASINSAISQLELLPVTDKAALLAALNAADALDEGDYAAPSWAVLAGAVAHGQAVADDIAATQDHIDAAEEAINDAIAALVPVNITDKTALQNAYTGYCVVCAIPGTCEPDLVTACNAAQSVLDDEDATQEDVDDALQDLIAEAPDLPVEIGQPFGGGYYIGDQTISEGGPDDGTYAIIMAGPEGNARLPWKIPARTSIAKSYVNGRANTLEMQADDPDAYQAGMHCLNYNGGGHTDWHMPARQDLRLAQSNWESLAALELWSPDSDSWYWSSTAAFATTGYDDAWCGDLAAFSVKNKTWPQWVVRNVRPVRRLLRYGPLPAQPLEFDPSLSNNTLTFSPDGKTVTGMPLDIAKPYDQGKQAVSGAVKLLSSGGKWQFEAEVVEMADGAAHAPVWIGITGAPTPSPSGYPGRDKEVPSTSVSGDGRVAISLMDYYGGSSKAPAFAAFGKGDVITVGIDMDQMPAVMTWKLNGVPFDVGWMGDISTGWFADPFIGFRVAVALGLSPDPTEPVSVTIRGKGLLYPIPDYQDWEP